MNIREAAEQLDKKRAAAVVVAFLVLIGAVLFVVSGSNDSAVAGPDGLIGSEGADDGTPYIPANAQGLVQVPQVVGETRDLAEAALRARDLRMLAFGDEEIATSQTPIAGTEVEPGTQIIVRFGELAGKDAENAEKAEEAAGGRDPVNEAAVNIPADPTGDTPLPPGIGENVGKPATPTGPAPTVPNDGARPEDERFTTGVFYVTWDPSVPTSVDAQQEFRLTDNRSNVIRSYPLSRGNGCQRLDLTFPAKRGHEQIIVSLYSKTSDALLGSVSFTVAQAAAGFNGRVVLENMGSTPQVRFHQDPTRLGC